MNLKQKIREIFSMVEKNNNGFTLVELIVVIAILAILGGVAVPAYSGYVKKAEKAADEALLNEINMAFASACTLAGENHFFREDGTQLKFNGKVVESLITGSDQVDQNFNSFFESFATEFKSIDVNDIMYVKAEGRFREAGVITVEYAGGTLTISEKHREAFLASGLAELGVEYLLGEMDNVVSYAAGYEELLTNVRNEDDFKDLCNLFEGYSTADDAKKKEIEMQALVLYTAEQYKSLDRDTLYTNIINSGGGYISNYSTDGEDFAANAAMYSLGLKFADTDEGKKIMDEKGWNASDPDDIQELMTYREEDKHTVTGVGLGSYGPNQFITWLENNEDEAKANLDGFGGAMGMLSDNKNNLDTDMLLEGGYGATGDNSLADSLGNAIKK